MKLSQAAVHYTDVASRSNEACWACTHFLPSGDRFAACRIVAGTIAPGGWCDRFARATAAERHARHVPGSVLNPGGVPYRIQYRDADYKVRVERVKEMSGRDYVTASGRIVSPTRVMAVDDREPNPAGQLWYPGGVGIGQDAQGNYMAIPIESTIGWDVVTLRSMFPGDFDAMKLGVFEARLGYESSGQHGYSLFKIRVGGKWSKPMRLRTQFTSFPGAAKRNPVLRFAPDDLTDYPRANPRRSKPKYYEFTPEDVGQWIDGAFSHEHAMKKMADMLGDVDSQRAQNLLDEYDDGELGDEGEQEWLDDATEALQEVTREGLVWEWDAGDLYLRETEED